MTPAVAKKLPLVEPGGYLQWDEFDLNSYAAHSPATNVSKHFSDQIIKVWRGFTEKLGLKFEYVPSVPGSREVSRG